MAEPSVKGNMLLGSVVMTRRLRDANQLPAEIFEKVLSAETLELLDERISIANWYPMWQCNELQTLFWEYVAKRDPNVARQSGAESFKSMQKTGRYQQFEYAERAESAESKRDVLRQTRMITSILSGYYNFLEVEVGLHPETENLQIIYDNATLFIEPLRYSTEGFMTGVSRVRKGTTSWTSERVTPDRIVYTLPNANKSN
jgi:hypothetical protein